MIELQPQLAIDTYFDKNLVKEFYERELAIWNLQQRALHILLLFTNIQIL